MKNAHRVSIKKLAGVFVVASILSVSASANAVVLTFDDLPSNMDFIQNGYGGFQWNNFGSLNAKFNNTQDSGGYGTGTVSGSNVAFNWGASPATFSSVNTFILSDAFFTGAWNDGLQIHVVATGGSNTYTKDFTVNASGPIDVFFNWSNINSVSFSSSGGVPHAGFRGAGTHFAMDNLTINPVVTPVPEPATYALLLAGLGIIGFVARRRGNFSV